MRGRLAAPSGLIWALVLLPLFAPAVSGQHPAKVSEKRKTEINIMLAWLADEELCRFYPCARHGGDHIQVGGFVPNHKLRQRALQIAEANSGHRVEDQLKVISGISISPRRVPNHTLLRNAALALETEFRRECSSCKLSMRGNGQLTVEGLTISFTRKLNVSERLRRIPGCVCVLNKLVVASRGTVLAAAGKPTIQIKGMPNNQRGGQSASPRIESSHTGLVTRPTRFQEQPLIAPKQALPDSDGPILPLLVADSNTTNARDMKNGWKNRPVVELPQKPVLYKVDRLPKLMPVPSPYKRTGVFKKSKTNKPSQFVEVPSKTFVSHQAVANPADRKTVKTQWRAAPVTPNRSNTTLEQQKQRGTVQENSNPARFRASSPYYPVQMNLANERDTKSVVPYASHPRRIASSIAQTGPQTNDQSATANKANASAPSWIPIAANNQKPPNIRRPISPVAYQTPNQKRTAPAAKGPALPPQVRSSQSPRPVTKAASLRVNGNGGTTQQRLTRLILQSYGPALRQLKVEIKSNRDLAIWFAATSEANSDIVARQILSMPQINQFNVKLTAEFPR